MGDVTNLIGALSGDVATGGMRQLASWGFDTTNTGSNFTIADTIADTTGGGGGGGVTTQGGRIGVAKLGTGTLTLSGNNTYTYGTRVDGGTLIVGHANALGSGTGFLQINDGTLDLGTFELNRGGGIRATGGELSNGVISGTGSLIKTGTGVFRVSADANTFTGSAAIQAGVVEVSSVSGTLSAQSLGSGSTAIALGSGTDTGTYRFIGSNSGTTNRNFTLAGSTGGGVIEASGLLNITGTVTAVAGSKTLTLGGANTGTNRIGSIGDGSGVVSVDKAGAGTWYLTGANAFTGSFTLSHGTVVVDAASAISTASERRVGSPAANSSGTAALFVADGQSVENVDVTSLGADGQQQVFLGNLTGSGAFGGSTKLGRAVNLVAGGTMRFENTWTGTSGSGDPAVNVTFGNATSLGKVFLANNLITSGSVRINNGVLSVANGNTLTGSAGPVIVSAGAELGGSGRVAGTVAGGGWISPGDSPGILTVTALDPSEGTDFRFELSGPFPNYSTGTSSVNDVLRIEDLTTPFTSSLTSSNIVSIYFNVGTLTPGDVFQGGFYTDRQSDFWTSVENGTFNYYVSDNSGTEVYNGQVYSALSTLYPSLTVSRTTAYEASTFTGTSGWITQFTIGTTTASTSYTLSTGVSASTIIVGGTSTITATVTNTGTGMADSLAVSGLGVTASPSGSVTDFSPTSGTAANSGGSLSGNGVFTSTTAGTYGFTPIASGSNATIGGEATLTTTSTASVTVLDHSQASLSGTDVGLTGTVSLGTWDWQLNSWVNGSGTGAYVLWNLAATSPSLTAALDVSGTSLSGDAGFSTDFDLGSYGLIAGGSSSSFLAMYDPSASGTVSGTYTATFTFLTQDANLPGAMAGDTLILTAQVVVVPEPGSLAIAGIGIVVVTLALRRSGRKAARKAVLTIVAACFAAGQAHAVTIDWVTEGVLTAVENGGAGQSKMVALGGDMAEVAVQHHSPKQCRLGS